MFALSRGKRLLRISDPLRGGCELTDALHLRVASLVNFCGGGLGNLFDIHSAMLTGSRRFRDSRGTQRDSLGRCRTRRAGYPFGLRRPPREAITMQDLQASSTRDDTWELLRFLRRMSNPLERTAAVPSRIAVRERGERLRNPQVRKLQSKLFS